MSERSLRRQLRVLERIGVVKRIWHEGRRGVILDRGWRHILSEPVRGERESMQLSMRLVRRLCKAVVDSVFLETLIESDPKVNQFEEVPRRCIRIEGAAR